MYRNSLQGNWRYDVELEVTDEIMIDGAFKTAVLHGKE
jgi:hypothetical protein